MQLMRCCDICCVNMTITKKTNTMNNPLTTSDINFMVEAAIIICNISKEEAIKKVSELIIEKGYSVKL